MLCPGARVNISTLNHQLHAFREYVTYIEFMEFMQQQQQWQHRNQHHRRIDSINLRNAIVRAERNGRVPSERSSEFACGVTRGPITQINPPHDANGIDDGACANCRRRRRRRATQRRPEVPLINLFCQPRARAHDSAVRMCVWVIGPADATRGESQRRRHRRLMRKHTDA